MTRRFDDYEVLDEAINKTLEKMENDAMYIPTRAYLEFSPDDVKGFSSLIDDTIRVFVDVNKL